MNTLVISINWEYFLGLFGTLLGIAYYANGRFTRLETSVEWLTETLRGLKIASENATMKFFDTNSPVTYRENQIMQCVFTQAGSSIFKDANAYLVVRRKCIERGANAAQVRGVCRMNRYHGQYGRHKKPLHL